MHVPPPLLIRAIYSERVPLCDSWILWPDMDSFRASRVTLESLHTRKVKYRETKRKKSLISARISSNVVNGSRIEILNFAYNLSFSGSRNVVQHSHKGKVNSPIATPPHPALPVKWCHTCSSGKWATCAIIMIHSPFTLPLE